MSKPERSRKAADEADSELDFDARLERLEGIVRELEGSDLGLEAAIERYAEGVELLKRCHGALNAHRKRVEELSGEAEATLAPLRDDPDFTGREDAPGA